MVTVFFRGGLGNQLFQYAAGLSFAQRNNTGTIFDIVHVNDRFPRANFTYRTFDLPEVFAIEPSYTRLSVVSSKIKIPGVWLGLDLFFMNLAQALGSSKMVYENEKKGFDGEAFEARGNLILYGRWENENYFKGIEAVLREKLRFRNRLTGGAVRLAEEIEKANSVSIHIRRGDFVESNKVKGLMAVVGSDYYAKAIAHIKKNVSRPHFFIFSNDIEWCKQNFRVDAPTTYVEPQDAGPHGAFDLELMSRCKHNIIANSTFSWWGAWLNINPGKIVVAPSRWFADPSMPADIVPRAWVRM